MKLKMTGRTGVIDFARSDEVFSNISSVIITDERKYIVYKYLLPNAFAVHGEIINEIFKGTK